MRWVEYDDSDNMMKVDFERVVRGLSNLEGEWYETTKKCKVKSSAEVNLLGDRAFVETRLPISK
jgi:hypothetical protein